MTREPSLPFFTPRTGLLAIWKSAGRLPHTLWMLSSLKNSTFPRWVQAPVKSPSEPMVAE